jgi:hypothetical protein
MLMIGLVKDLKLIVSDEMKAAYIHGFKSAAEEDNVNIIQKSGVNVTKNIVGDGLLYKGKRLDIDFDQEDEDAIRALQTGKMQTNVYNELSIVLSTKLNQEINNSIVEGLSIPNTVAEMQKIIKTETYKLTRIARTEITNVTNEGRLASYRKQEKLRKKPFKYTLVVASGSRTCEAHQELQRRIPATGLLMDDLLQLQQSVGSSYGFTLRGNSLLHPNQRTVLMRVP